MPVVIAPQYTQRILDWEDWKVEQAKRLGTYQCVADNDAYIVWFMTFQTHLLFFCIEA